MPKRRSLYYGNLPACNHLMLLMASLNVMLDDVCHARIQLLMAMSQLVQEDV